MTMKINEAIQNARDCMQFAIPREGPESPEQAAQLATAWALIAIAEAILLENQRADYRDEIAEMRSKREARQRSGNYEDD